MQRPPLQLRPFASRAGISFDQILELVIGDAALYVIYRVASAFLCPATWLTWGMFWYETGVMGDILRWFRTLLAQLRSPA